MNTWVHLPSSHSFPRLTATLYSSTQHTQRELILLSRLNILNCFPLITTKIPSKSYRQEGGAYILYLIFLSYTILILFIFPLFHHNYLFYQQYYVTTNIITIIGNHLTHVWYITTLKNCTVTTLHACMGYIIKSVCIISTIVNTCIASDCNRQNRKKCTNIIIEVSMWVGSHWSSACHLFAGRRVSK